MGTTVRRRITTDVTTRAKALGPGVTTNVTTRAERRPTRQEAPPPAIPVPHRPGTRARRPAAGTSA